MLRSFVISDVVLGVTNDAYFKNDICRKVSQRLVAVLVNFNVNGAVFRKIFVFLLESCWVSFKRLNSTLITKI